MPLVCSQNRTGFNVNPIMVVSLSTFIGFIHVLKLEDILTVGKPSEKREGPMGVARFRLV